MKKILVTISLFLSASVQAYAETEIDRLLNTSQQITNQIQNARMAVVGSFHAAATGQGIVESGAITQYGITEQQMYDYNMAIEDIKNATYYNAKMFFEDKHEQAMVELSSAVDRFTHAAEELVKVEATAEVAAEIEENNVDDQIALQEFVQEADVELTQQDIVAYNDSLEDIENTSQEAAAFLMAAHSDFIKDESDHVAQHYNQNIKQAQVDYKAINDTLTVTWSTHQWVSYTGFFGNDFLNSAEVMGIGQSIYEGNEYQ